MELHSAAHPNHQPIGYWLVRLHHQLEEGLASELFDYGLSRRHWQMMNALHHAAADEAELAERMPPSWVDDTQTLESVQRDLSTRSWISRNDGRFALTDTGRTAHSRIAQRVKAFRRASTAGISDEEYLAAIEVLQRMAHNLASR